MACYSHITKKNHERKSKQAGLGVGSHIIPPFPGLAEANMVFTLMNVNLPPPSCEMQASAGAGFHFALVISH